MIRDYKSWIKKKLKNKNKLLLLNQNFKRNNKYFIFNLGNCKASRRNRRA